MLDELNLNARGNLKLSLWELKPQRRVISIKEEIIFQEEEEKKVCNINKGKMIAERKRIEKAFRKTKFEILEITTESGLTLEWLLKNKLHHGDQIPCENSNWNGYMDMATDNSRIDKWRYSWDTCEWKWTSRIGSFFKQFCRTPLVMIVRVVFYYYIEMKNASETYEEINSYCKDGGKEIISYSQIVTVYNIIRKMVADFYLTNMNAYKLSGEVEIDETLLAHDNYAYEAPTNKYKRQIWTLGLVERGTNVSYWFTINSKSHNDINPIINQYVAEGTKIFHDGMKAYNLIEHPYLHQKIDRTDKDPSAEKTLWIDTLWTNIRYYTRKVQGGMIKQEQLTTFLPEILLRIQCKRQKVSFFDKLVEIIKIYFKSIKFPVTRV